MTATPKELADRLRQHTDDRSQNEGIDESEWDAMMNLARDIEALNILTLDEKRIIAQASAMRWLARSLMRCAQYVSTADRKRRDWMNRTPIGSLVFEASSGHEDHDRIGHVVALSDRKPDGDRDCITIRVLATGEIKRWHNASFVRIPSTAREFDEFEGVKPIDDRYVCTCAICTRAADALCELCGDPRNT